MRDQEKYREYQKQYRMKNKEKREQYRLEHKAEHQERCRSYYEENRDQLLERARLRRLADPDRVKAKNRKNNLARRGLTDDQYNIMLQEQGGGCAICGAQKPGGRGAHFHVDHCHRTGAIRGLLCSLCNTGLGALGDTAESLKKALLYLEKHR